MTVGSQAPLLYTFDAIPSMPYDEADPPHLPVPWLNIYDTRDFLSFLAEPLFRRSDGLASVVDLRVHSERDFPKSHSAYWELGPVWDAIATAFSGSGPSHSPCARHATSASRHARRLSVPTRRRAKAMAEATTASQERAPRRHRCPAPAPRRAVAPCRGYDSTRVD